MSAFSEALALASLDPSSPEGWESLRDTLHEAADRLLDHVRDQRDIPVWQEMPHPVAEAIAGDAGRRERFPTGSSIVEVSG